MKVMEDKRRIELTRRNLQVLMAKLNGNPEGSRCTIGNDCWEVKAVENEEHYAWRRPGSVHPSTESSLADSPLTLQDIAREVIDAAIGEGAYEELFGAFQDPEVQMAIERTKVS